MAARHISNFIMVNGKPFPAPKRYPNMVVTTAVNAARRQMLIGAIVITTLEFVCGCIVNLWLGWNVWDYSNMPFNLLGQICLPFTVIWFFLSAVAVVLDDWIRHILWGEDMPHYKWR